MLRPAATVPSRPTRLPRPVAARAVLRDRRGIGALEFAAVGSLVMTMTLAVVELSLQVATSAALEWSAQRASRFGITGSSTLRDAPASMPSCRSRIIPWLVTYSTAGFLAGDQLTLEMTSYGDNVPATPSDPGQPGPGAAGEVVSYHLTYRQPFITPIAVMLAGRSEVIHQANVLVRNERFEDATC